MWTLWRINILSEGRFMKKVPLNIKKKVKQVAEWMIKNGYKKEEMLSYRNKKDEIVIFRIQ